MVVCAPHHQAHHQGCLEIKARGDGQFAIRHRSEPGGPWRKYPSGSDAPYDPEERAWDGPSYVREPGARYGAGGREAGLERAFRTAVGWHLSYLRSGESASAYG